MNYRWVNGWEASEAEWDRIDRILASRGWMSLSREFSRVRIVEDDEGKLVGFYVLQAIPHAEPMWVDKKYWGSGVADALADDMLEYLTEAKARGWVIIADNPVARKMCEERGMKKVESPVYVMAPEKEN